MKFGDVYFNRFQTHEPYLMESPDPRLGYAIIIPCYNEPDITTTLQSLWLCQRPEWPLEIIIVVNSSKYSNRKVLDTNDKTIQDIHNWKASHPDPSFKVYIIHAPNLPVKHLGAGLARKIGMDEAVRRFNLNNNPNGVLISFDADTICDSNFLVELEKAFFNEPSLNGCTVYFEHPTQFNDNPRMAYAIVQYELYLRYFVEGLRYAAFPYAFHTLGSCFSVKAGIYASEGGFNKRKAGEDFYFLHKIIPLGHFREVNTTRVQPSARASLRVPFGTGPVVHSLMQSDKELEGYHFRSFLDIKQLFELLSDLYQDSCISKKINNLAEPLQNFLRQRNLFSKIEEIKAHSASYATFRKRFFQWFGAFTIIKYFNFVHHEGIYNKQPVVREVPKLLQHLDIPYETTDQPEELLAVLRTCQKQRTFRN